MLSLAGHMASFKDLLTLHALQDAVRGWRVNRHSHSQQLRKVEAPFDLASSKGEWQLGLGVSHLISWYDLPLKLPDGIVTSPPPLIVPLLAVHLRSTAFKTGCGVLQSGAGQGQEGWTAAQQAAGTG